MRGWKATSSAAKPIRKGTTTLKVELGSWVSRKAPITAPMQEATDSRTRVLRWVVRSSPR